MYNERNKMIIIVYQYISKDHGAIQMRNENKHDIELVNSFEFFQIDVVLNHLEEVISEKEKKNQENQFYFFVFHQ